MRLLLHLLFLAAVGCWIFPALVDADQPYSYNLTSYQNGVMGDQPSQTFRSSPLVAPVYQINAFNINRIDTEASPYIFMAGSYGGAWGPSIVSSTDLSLVWAIQSFGGIAQGARTAIFQGARVLSVFVGDCVRIYSESYEELYAVTMQGEYFGVTPDAHEGLLTHDDTVILLGFPFQPADLSAVGGPKEGAMVANGVTQEIDPVTNEVLFQFSTLDHFSAADSIWFYNQEEVWDYCHMNSVQKTEDGNYIISYRHLGCVIMVNGTTADIIWIMGGKRNMFKDVSKHGLSAKFHYQHEARMTGKNRFTIFDNHRLDNGFCAKGQCSRGLELEYDPVKMTVWVVDEWYHPQGVISASRGGVQRTPGGNVLITWGQNPLFTEYTPDGDLVMDFQRGQVLTIEHGIGEIVAYRGWKGEWEGNPPWGPSIAGSANMTHSFVYVSWNGATKAKHYVLLSSDRDDDINGTAKTTAQSLRMGFETEFIVPLKDMNGDLVRIAALDVDGNIIGSTPLVDVASGEVRDVDYAINEVAFTKPASIPSTFIVDPRPPGAESVSKKAHKHIAAASIIAGGAGVGVAAVSIGLAAFLLLRRRRHQRHQPIPQDDEDAQNLLKESQYEFELEESSDRDSEDGSELSETFHLRKSTDSSRSRDS